MHHSGATGHSDLDLVGDCGRGRTQNKTKPKPVKKAQLHIAA
jgi:hypothetical protein